MKREVKIGGFALLMVVCLYWGVNFLKGRDLLSRNNTYYATYAQVNGMQSSSPVFIKGFKVGTVSDIRFDPQTDSRVVVAMTLNKKYRLPSDSQAKIFSNGIMGGKAIEIELGSAETFLSNRDTLRSKMDKDIMEVAGSELEFFKQKIGGTLAEMDATLAGLNALIEENRQHITGTLGNVEALSGELSGIVRKESTDIREMIAGLAAVSGTLRRRAESIDRIIGNIETVTDSLSSADIAGTVAHLSSTLASVNETIDAINRGEGSLGKLMNDEALYDSLVSASGNLAALLEDLKAHPGRYVHFSVFGGKNKNKDK